VPPAGNYDGLERLELAKAIRNCLCLH
jgi:hypothetical protein